MTHRKTHSAFNLHSDTFSGPILGFFILATDPKTATAEIEIVLILCILANFMLTSTIILYDLAYFDIFRFIPVIRWYFGYSSNPIEMHNAKSWNFVIEHRFMKLINEQVNSDIRGNLFKTK